MVKHRILLPDGTVISSGAPGQAISGVEITWTVNEGEELNPGAVCAAMAEIQIIDCPAAPLCAGEEFSLYEGETLLGRFIAQRPERKNPNCFTLTAYDRVSLLDKRIDGLLLSLTGSPYTLGELAQKVCDYCGVSLKAEALSGGEHLVSPFSGEQVTGRTVMKWIAQALGKFCRATPTGELEFAWYTPCPREIGPQGVPYLGSSLQYADYITAPIQKVQIRYRAEDVGSVYPGEGENALIIEGNPLLCTEDGEKLLPIAENLYNSMQGLSYTPFTLSIQAGEEILPGQIVKITDSGGKILSGLVMTKVRTGQKDTLSCTGAPSRESVEAINRQSYESLAGRVLNLTTDVSGIRAENKDISGNLSSLQMAVEGISTEVSRQAGQAGALRSELTKVSQTADALSVQVKTISGQGVNRVVTQTGYRFDDLGLHIQKSDSEMENRLDHTGMFVQRSGETILQANAAGVVATDVSVRNYLMVGSHARFEDYEGGTGCFYL